LKKWRLPARDSRFAPDFFVAEKRYRHYLPLGQSQRSSRNIVLYAPQ
jgi:hypothetical protein